MGREQDNWYVVSTNPQCEKKATGELRRAGVRVYLPKRTFEARNRKTGVVSVKNRPLLVGYLFIRFEGVPNWYAARQCQGVKDVLRFMNDVGEWEPFPIPSELVGAMMRRQRSREFDDIERRRRMRTATYRKGQKMRVIEGPFASFLATIETLHKNGRVDATVDIFGRETLISFEQPDYSLKSIANNTEAA